MNLPDIDVYQNLREWSHRRHRFHYLPFCPESETPVPDEDISYRIEFRPLDRGDTNISSLWDIVRGGLTYAEACAFIDRYRAEAGGYEYRIREIRERTVVD